MRKDELRNRLADTTHATPLDCPLIELNSPAKIPHQGGLLEYSVNVETGGEEIELEYLWAAVYPDYKTGKRKNAEIVSGQGTPDVRIKMPGDRITVSVIIGGIREGCPMMASETVSYTPAPEAEMLEEFTGPAARISKARLYELRYAFLNESPDSSLVIFIGSKGERGAAGMTGRRNFLVKHFSKHFPPDRITYVTLDVKEDIIQFWLVPAGASPPTFKRNTANFTLSSMDKCRLLSDLHCRLL